MGTVAVLGSANLDLVVSTSRRPEPGETIIGNRFSSGPGGKGLNQAIAAARAGARVRMLGAIGSDVYSESLLRLFEAEGIELAGVRRVDLPTGVAQITVTEDGENSIVVVPGANASTRFDDSDREMIASASHLVVQLERPRSLVEEAMSFARSLGVATVLTPAPVGDDLESLVSLADYIVPNEEEALALTGCDDAASAASALSVGTSTAIVTLGSRGALVAQQGEIHAVVPPRKVVAVDTTAAGDTFVGYLTAFLAQGSDLAAAMHAATIAASITVTRVGAADTIPRLTEVSAAH